MINVHQEELASLYALDLLEGEERVQFESLLTGDPSLQRLVVELRDSAAWLGRAAAVEAPGELKARVLGSLASESVAVPAPARTRPRANARVVAFKLFVPWAVAAGLAVVGLWLGQQLGTTTSQLSLAQAEAELAQLGLRSARGMLEAERIVLQQQTTGLESQLADTRQQLALAGTALADLERRRRDEVDLANLRITALASLLDNSPEARAIAVWDPARQEGVLTVEKLPALATTQDYQLWVVDPQYPNPVDGGVFSVDPVSGAARVSFRGRQPVGVVNAFAVTLERKGGVPKAEGPFVLLGQ